MKRKKKLTVAVHSPYSFPCVASLRYSLQPGEFLDLGEADRERVQKKKKKNLTSPPLTFLFSACAHPQVFAAAWRVPGPRRGRQGRPGP